MVTVNVDLTSQSHLSRAVLPRIVSHGSLVVDVAVTVAVAVAVAEWRCRIFEQGSRFQP